MEDAKSHIQIWYRLAEEPRSSLGWPVLFAILLHLLVYQLAPNRSLVTAPTVLDKNAPIVIDALDEKQRKPVVSTSRSLEDFEDSSPAPFHAEERNRVRKQMRATLKGTFQEGTSKKGTGNTGALDPDAIGEPGNSGEQGDRLGMHDLMSFARTPHALSKDIPEGGQTLLNTDKVLYASFINRIAEEIYEPWVQYSQDGLREALKRGRKIEPTTYITKLNVVMNESGEVVAMTIMEGSGIMELDEAPKKAFWRIARFANPPAQLIDKDGLLRLNYEFHFEWRSGYFNIVPYPI